MSFFDDDLVAMILFFYLPIIIASLISVPMCLEYFEHKSKIEGCADGCFFFAIFIIGLPGTILALIIFAIKMEIKKIKDAKLRKKEEKLKAERDKEDQIREKENEIRRKQEAIEEQIRKQKEEAHRQTLFSNYRKGTSINEIVSIILSRSIFPYEIFIYQHEVRMLYEGEQVLVFHLCTHGYENIESILATEIYATVLNEKLGNRYRLYPVDVRYSPLGNAIYGEYCSLKLMANKKL